MIITDKAWNRYISVLRELNNKAAEEMIRFMTDKGWTTMNGKYVLTSAERKELIEYAYGLATKYGEGAAAAACEMYDAVAIAQKAKVKPFYIEINKKTVGYYKKMKITNKIDKI